MEEICLKVACNDASLAKYFHVQVYRSFILQRSGQVLKYSIQLTNWILWNGKFYYWDVIKITITRAKLRRG